MTTDGIIGEQTTSNHVMEVADVLGIEAARYESNTGTLFSQCTNIDI